MTDGGLLRHNQALVQYVSRLLHDLEDCRRDQRVKDQLAARAIEDRLKIEKQFWGLQEHARDLEHELLLTKAFAAMLEEQQARAARPAAVLCRLAPPEARQGA